MDLDGGASVVQTDRLGSIVTAPCSTEPPNDAQTGYHTNANRGVLYNKSSYVDSKLILSTTKPIKNEIPLIRRVCSICVRIPAFGSPILSATVLLLLRTTT